MRMVALRTDGCYVLSREGKEGLKKVEAAMQDLGHPVSYEEIRAMEWCPLGLRVLSLLVIKDSLGWDEAGIKALGYAAITHSFVARLFMKALASPRLAISRAPEYWRSHYNVGRLEADFSKGERSVDLFIKDLGGHPLLCRYLEGYFERAIQFLLPKRKVGCVETECVFRGDAHHRFEVSWQD